MPEGEGPFPLTLIVHGNHNMIDYSDEGYGYLGNLLASRGIIVVSVDQNFINGHWSGDFMGKAGGGNRYGVGCRNHPGHAPRLDGSEAAFHD